MKLGKLSVARHGRGRKIVLMGRFPKVFMVFKRGTSSGVEYVFDSSKLAHWHVRFTFWKAG